MENFQSFVEHMVSRLDQNIKTGSFLQVTLKNYDQLSSITAKGKLEEVNSKSIDLIKDVFKEDKSAQIFEYNKFFYIITNLSDEYKLWQIADKIHDKLIYEFSGGQFVDARVTGCKFNENTNLKDLIHVLSDHIHYNDETSIFTWIEDANNYKQKLEKDYFHLKEIRDCIVNNKAYFAFQPIVECKTGKVAYHECLLRLSDDDFHLISAGPYIMLAERYGYICNVDKYVFDMAVRELRESNISLSINLSNIGVQNKILHEHFYNKLKGENIADRLTIEITETAVNNDFKTTIKFIESMKSLGAKIALDDFGAGHTSYRQVRQLPIDILKIDGSYVRDIYKNDKNKSIVEAFIRTAEDFNCKTVAEFVENGLVAKTLIDMKIDYMQGNFFSPAINYRSWEKN